MSLIEVSNDFVVSDLRGSPGFTVTSGGFPVALSVTAGLIYEQRYERDGTLIETTIHDSTSATVDAGPVTLVELTNGSLVGLYARSNAGGTAIRIFDADGTPLTDFMNVPLVDGAASGFEYNLWLSANPTGGFSVMIGSDSGFYGNSATLSTLNGGTVSRLQDVRLVEYDNDGHLAYNPYYANAVDGIATSWTGPQVASNFTTLTDGRIVVAYTDQFYRPNTQDNYYMSGMGASAAIIQDGYQTSEFVVYAPPYQTQPSEGYVDQTTISIAPVTEATSDGGFVILYAARNGGLPYYWHAQFYDAAGGAVGATINFAAVSNFAYQTGSAPLTAMMADGRVAILSSEFVTLGARNIYLTVIDANGVVESQQIASFNTGQGVSGLLSLDIGADNSILVRLQGDVMHRYVLSDEGAFADATGGTINGTAQADLIIGAEGNDVLRGFDGPDQIEGHDGNDRLSGGTGNDLLLAGAGDDTVWGGSGDDRINAAAGADSVMGEDGNDTILAGDGLNTLSGGVGNDQIFGGMDSDRINGDAGQDLIMGGDGRDTISGDDGNDTIHGGETDSDRGDVIYGGQGDDVIFGDYGNDEISGGLGRDTVEGGYGADTLIGNQAADVLNGGVNADQILGGDGDDTINGGFGNDRLVGGTGADMFLHTGLAGHGSDWIQDYHADEGDRLWYVGTDSNINHFQVSFAQTAAGDHTIDEAFVVYRPTGQILFALVDGAAQDHINIIVGGVEHDLLA